jgi:hypothetical protein
MGDSTIQDLKNTLETCSKELIPQPPEEFDAEAAANLVLKMAQDFVNDHSSDVPSARRNSGPKRDTPGAETFFWSVWETTFKEIGKWDFDHESSPNITKCIATIKALQSQPKGKYTWTIWGEDVDITSLPLLGPSIREANNGAICHIWAHHLLIIVQ